MPKSVRCYRAGIEFYDAEAGNVERVHRHQQGRLKISIR
jgi:hypothetical protein